MTTDEACYYRIPVLVQADDGQSKHCNKVLVGPWLLLNAFALGESSLQLQNVDKGQNVYVCIYKHIHRQYSFAATVHPTLAGCLKKI